jgi:hypothetical protein
VKRGKTGGSMFDENVDLGQKKIGQLSKELNILKPQNPQNKNIMHSVERNVENKLHTKLISRTAIKVATPKLREPFKELQNAKTPEIHVASAKKFSELKNDSPAINILPEKRILENFNNSENGTEMQLEQPGQDFSLKPICTKDLA